MGDVDGGLLKCVMQLAACSGKLLATDAHLEAVVRGMKRQMAPMHLPVLKAKVAVAPVDSVNSVTQPEQRFQELYDHGCEETERLEVQKMQREKELERCSEQFKELVSSRNADIQEEYKRMLNELDEQAESLTAAIEEKRQERHAFKRRRTTRSASPTATSMHTPRKSADLKRENSSLKSEVKKFSQEITRLQYEFAELERESTAEDAANKEDNESKTEDVEGEVVALRQELRLLRDAKHSIAAARPTSFKAQFAEEISELEDEIAHLKRATEQASTQLGSHGLRLQSLLRTLAPNASIGTLMTRLHQQLMSDSSTGPRKTVELQGFLNTCPSVEEGKQAIDEMKKLQLIYCYESSGLIVLAD